MPGSGFHPFLQRHVIVAPRPRRIQHVRPHGISRSGRPARLHSRESERNRHEHSPHGAERLGDRTLAYRVGQAVGANPLCIFVPCHRVLGANGSLTGYAGGLKRKQALLELEEPVQVRAGRLF
ncbi:MGMT family protein [Acrocarpospora sp. B8E8]|uniref:methylated-DNA--[protein]-cysteine S-methyltransferase n=1 Tax=Acrocarpospora sp. B8E8 TaxID=3153572 RepID=UPI00325CD8AA